MEPIIIKGDKRFRKGHIKHTGNVLRGHPETMKLERLDMPLSLNPPIVVSPELAKALKEQP